MEHDIQLTTKHTHTYQKQVK